jgi:hypothetical protein
MSPTASRSRRPRSVDIRVRASKLQIGRASRAGRALPVRCGSARSSPGHCRSAPTSPPGFSSRSASRSRGPIRSVGRAAHELSRSPRSECACSERTIVASAGCAATGRTPTVPFRRRSSPRAQLLSPEVPVSITYATRVARCARGSAERESGVKWLSAKCRMKYRACRLRRPPVTATSCTLRFSTRSRSCRFLRKVPIDSGGYCAPDVATP